MASCKLCARESDEIRWRTREFAVFHCRPCGVLFIPQAETAPGEDVYSEEYFNVRGMTQPAYASAIRKMKRHTFARHFRVLGRVCPDLKPPGPRLLDVGCAVGFLPELAKDLGYDAFGVEVSPAGARIAADRLPGRIKSGTVGEARYDDAYFDVVTASDVIEHVPDPAEFIAEIGRITRHGGVFLLTTPDFNSLSARLLGKRWPNVKEEHIWYFSRDGLRDLLRDGGFDVVEMRAATKSATLDYGRRQFEANPRPPITQLLKLVRFLPRFLRDRAIPIRIGDVLVVARKR